MESIFRQMDQKERAQGMLEFALVLPVLLTLIYGVMEVGRMLFIYSSVASASREAARYGAAAGVNDSGVPRFHDCSGIRAAAVRIGGIAGVENNAAGVDIQYDNGSPASPLGTCNSGTVSTIPVTLGGRVVVTVRADFKPIIPLAPLRPFTIQTITARTIVKDISVGSAVAPPTPPQVTFNLSSPTFSEPGGSLIVQAELDRVSPQDVVVPFIFGGTAVQGVDYTVSANSLVIPAGSLNESLTLTAQADALWECDEPVMVEMGTPTNGTKATSGPRTAALLDDSPPPAAAFSTASQGGMEGQSLSAVVNLSAPACQDLSLTFTASGSAGEGSDFIAASPVVIPQGQLQGSLTIDLLADGLDEDEEAFQLQLVAPSGAVLGSPSSHTVTIADNDPPPTIAFTWVEQSGTEETGDLVVEVNLDVPSGKEVTVPLLVSGTASMGDDYGLSAESVTFPTGSTTAQVLVTLKPDLIEEDDETVILTLGSPVNATRSSLNAVHTITITNVVPLPTVSFSAASATTAEASTSLQILVQLSSASNRDISIPFTVSGSADPLVDYAVLTSPLVIPAGSAGAAIQITPVSDALDEDDETVVLTLGTPTNAKKGAPSVFTATITDDDALPVVSFLSSGQTVSETDGSLTVVIQLSAPSGKPVTVPFSLSGTAGNPDDFTVTPASPLTIPAGSGSLAVTINLVDDTQDEPQETLALTLGTPVNASKGAPETHTIIIVDDDEPICKLDTNQELLVVPAGLDGKYISWTLANLSDHNLLLSEAKVEWPGDTRVPGQSPKLNSVEMSWASNPGTRLWSGDAPYPSLTIDQWDALAGDRLFLNPKQKTIRFYFSRDLIPGLHRVRLTFVNQTLGGIVCPAVEKTYTLLGQ